MLYIVMKVGHFVQLLLTRTKL